MAFTISMYLEGIPGVMDNFRRLSSTVQRQANTSSWNGAQHLYARTRAIVPYFEGDLYDAAYLQKVQEGNVPTWEVGYDTSSVPYAVAVHEIPAVHPTRGPSSEPKTDHFLSRPRDEMVKTFQPMVAKDMEKAIAATPFRFSSSRRRR